MKNGTKCRFSFGALEHVWETCVEESKALRAFSEAKRSENPQGVRRDFKGAKRLLKSKCRFEESGLIL
jgi:hypothetical protein